MAIDRRRDNRVLLAILVEVGRLGVGVLEMYCLGLSASIT